MPITVGTTDVTAISRAAIMPDFADAIYKSNVLFYRTNQANKVIIDGGYQIEKPVLYQRPGVGGAYSGYDVYNVSPFESFQNAAWDWKQYVMPVSVDGLTMIRTDSPEAIANYVKEKFNIANMELAMILGTDLYASTGAGADIKKLDGLASAVASTGTYGTIPHTNSYWQSPMDTGSPVLTLALMQSLWGKLTVGREHPTIILGRQGAYNIYWGLLVNKQNYQLQPAGTDELLGQAGFTNLLFNNAPFVVDSQVDIGTNVGGKVYMLNENTGSLKVSKRANFAMEDFQKPTNQDVMVAAILFAGNYILDNPRLSGVFTGLDTTHQ